MVYSDEDASRPDESSRLKTQVDAIWSREAELYRAVVQFPREGLVLEAGCGPGHVLARVRAEFAVQVLGVELRPEQLAVADVPVIQADLYQLPLPDASVALAFSRLVFRHLTDPDRALRELRRVVRPGGQILLVDADDGMLTLEPPPESWHRAWEQTKQAIRESGGDPQIGRRLPALLQDVGLRDIRTRVLTVTGDEIGHREFSATLLVPLLRAGGAHSCIEELRTWVDTKPFASASLVIAGGTVE